MTANPILKELDKRVNVGQTYLIEVKNGLFTLPKSGIYSQNLARLCQLAHEIWTDKQTN